MTSFLQKYVASMFTVDRALPKWQSHIANMDTMTHDKTMTQPEASKPNQHLPAILSGEQVVAWTSTICRVLSFLHGRDVPMVARPTAICGEAMGNRMGNCHGKAAVTTAAAVRTCNS